MATNAEEIKKALGDTKETSKMQQEERESGQKAILEKLDVLIAETRAAERRRAADHTTINQLLQALQTAAATPDELQVPSLTTKAAVPNLTAMSVAAPEPIGLDHVSISVRVIVDLSTTLYDTKGEHYKDINLTLPAEQCKTISKLDARVSLATVPGVLEELNFKFDTTDLKDLRRASKLTLYEPEFDQPFAKSTVLTRTDDNIYHTWFQRNVNTNTTGGRARACFKMSIMHMDDEQVMREARKEGMEINSGVERAQNKKARYFLVD